MKLFCSSCSGIYLLTSLLCAQDYYADYLSIGGGYFTASNGSTSKAPDLGYLVLNQNNIIGAEFHIKSISTNVFGVNNVGISSVTISLFYGYMFPDNVIRPYFAGGFSAGFNGINSNDVTRKRPELIIKDNLAESYGVFGLAGAQYVLSKQFSIFSDARYGVEYFYAFIEHVSDEFVNLGGLYGRLGVRITLNSSEDM